MTYTSQIKSQRVAGFALEDIRVNYKLTDNITLSNILDYNDVKDVKHYKFKVGIEYKFGE